VAIIGAGFGGLGLAARLLDAGRERFVVLEAGQDIGGTWRDNTYPGAACDVPSHLYSYSFFPATWPRRFARQPEILGYLRRLADAYGLWPRIRLGAEVVRLDFDEASCTWQVGLASGETLRAKVVVSAVGQLQRPRIPALPGLESFSGPSWHSARWRHDVDLRGLRVGVVGTGASAIQFVPEVAKVAAQTVVFQRSAPYVVPKVDRAYRPAELALVRRVPVLRQLDRARVYLYGESLGLGLVRSRAWLAALTWLWRRWMWSQVPDPALRAACTPDSVMGCKRILFSNDWYRTLRREDVALVTEAVAEVLPGGVRTTSGREVALDALIFGTGFETTDFLSTIEVSGRRGRRLAEHWAAGPRTHLGLASSGFPNLFFLYGPNTNLGSNSILFMLEGQIAHVLGALATMEAAGLPALEVRPEVEAEFMAWVEAQSRRTAWTSGCRSWYTTAEGRNTHNWPSFTFLYRLQADRFDPLAYRAVLPRVAAPVA
jgi:cation diffusion facilitator CzcD-associated flavoprotein CzcO